MKDESEIFFIVKGKVQIFIQDNKSNEDNIILKDLRVIKIKIRKFQLFFKEGDSFGEISFFTGNERLASAQSKDFTTLYLIKREDFLEVLKRFPEDYEKYFMIYDQINLENNYNALSIKCYSCEQKGHLSSQCPLIHYVPDRERIVKGHVFDPGQNQRFDVLRNPAKSSNALSSKKRCFLFI